MYEMESRITFEIPSRSQLEALASHNYSVLVTETNKELAGVLGNLPIETSIAEEAAEYEQLLADVWVGVVLTLMVLSCVCCMCSCLLYHKFQQWKRSVLEARAAANISNMENGFDNESLPSYTLVSGLPSYDEALRQLQQVKKQIKETSRLNNNIDSNWVPQTPPTPATPLTRLSVEGLFQMYRNNSQSTLNQNSTTSSESTTLQVDLARNESVEECLTNTESSNKL